MAKKDSSSKKRHEVIDGVTSDFVHQWYVDVYDIEGNRAENFLLFTSKNESSKFEQVGAIEDIMDGCAGKEGVPCNVIKIKGKNVSYKLDPLSFDSSHVREDEEYSLKKMGWVLCEEIKGTEDIVIAYEAVKNSEALLSSKNEERVKKRRRTQAPQPKSMVEDISQEESPTPSNLATRPSTLEENSLSKALVVSNPNMLREDAPSFDNIEPTNAQSTISLEVKGVEMTFDFPGVCEKKGKNEELGFHMFEKFFPFGPTTQFAIPVVKCEEAPPLYTYRTLAWDYVETLTNLFVNNPMAPATAAYLMPFVKENGVCSDWVQKKLTCGADAGPLPNGAKDIVTFFLRKKENPHESSSTLPWRVYVVGCNLEALELIHNVYKDPITIGVVVLDAAHGVEGMKWDSFKFGRLVSSLLKMTCDPKQFVLLSFLTRRQMATFEDALEGMKCKYTMLVGSVDFLPASNHFALGAIDTFVVLTLINMEKHFINLDRYVNNVNKPCILDNTIVDEGEKGKVLEEDQQLARAILKKKKHVINTTINAFNDEHEVVLDVFACGLASKVALLNHKKTIAVVCNTQEQRDVEAICWRAHARTKPNGDPQENHVEPQILEIPPQGVEESSQDLASIIMKERMKTTSDPHQLEIGTTLTSAMSQLQLCVILDLNGLLLQRCFARSQKFQSFHVGQHWVVLRPGCMEFLDALFARFRVGIWSTSLLKNVTAMIRCLETNAKKKYPFFMIWGQEQCHRHATKTIYRPDKMGVEAVFKPLKYVWSQFGDLCEHTRTILIDDSPYKACTNPIENCIFPKSYDVNHPDSILIEEVLPYLLRLDQSNDSCGLIKFDRYGQEPVQYGHDLYEQFKVVIDEWNKPNKDDVSSSCSVQFGSLNDKKREKYFQTSITSCFKSPAIIGSELSHVSTTKPPSFPPLKSTQIAKLQCLPLPSTMKDMEAMYIAQELGYDKHYINGRSARCFIQDLQKLYLHTK
ncbi:hypothetical protein L7F22_068671 [Adiantum nelumboides]|nr:hypothetical protein [Adiantum nelumboides]